MAERITVETLIDAPREKVWNYFTQPEHITKWSFASADWHCPRAVNDVRTGGTFSTRMEAKDGSQGFDFSGTYTDVVPDELIAYTINGDGREVEVLITTEDEGTRVSQTFEAETENPVEMQRGGWQTILDNFKAYVEAN